MRRWYETRERDADEGVWRRVNELVDRAPGPEDLLNHRLHLLAARRRREQGLDVPPSFVVEERANMLRTLAVASLLERVREATDGPLVLLKGPEIAARYPDPALRPFTDVDLLVPDAESVQRALLAADFQEIGDPDLYRGIHHLRPLRWAALPLAVEIHSSPKWLERLEPPRIEELISVAVPARAARDSILTLPPAHHTLILVAHSWAHEPLRRLLELIDVAVLAQEADRAEIDALARRLGLARAWRTTSAAVDALFSDGRRTFALRTWARNLPAVQGRTVLEAHFENWFSGFSAYPPRTALVVGVSALGRELRPAPGETWRQKLARTRLAIANWGRRRFEHDEMLERGGRR